MMPKGKPWIQAAIDVLDVKTAIGMAEMAVKAGADWIEAGTPLLYYESIKSIRSVVESAAGRPVVADFKAQDGVYKYFAKAAEYGAGYAVVLGVCDDGAVLEAVRAKKDTGIQVIADLYSVELDDLPRRAKELEALGVDAVYVHFGFDQSKYNKTRRPSDGVEEVVRAVDIPVGMGAFDLSSALEGVRQGASWVAIGAPVFAPGCDFEAFNEFVKAVKAAR